MKPKHVSFGIMITWSTTMNLPFVTSMRLWGFKEEKHRLTIEQLSVLKEEVNKRFDQMSVAAENEPDKCLVLADVSEATCD